MRMNNRGDIGFPEAMMAVMIACVVLAAYIGAVAMSSEEHDETPKMDRDEIGSSIRVANGSAVGDVDTLLWGMIEQEGFRGVSVICWIPGDDRTWEFSAGMMDGGISEDRFMRSVPSDDGQIVPMIFKVTICT